MAAGRRGSYRESEFRDQETDFVMSRRETGYSKQDYDRIRNGDRQYERGQGGARDSHVQESEVIKGGYYSTSSQVDSGSNSGGPRRCEFVETQANTEMEVKKLEIGNHPEFVETQANAEMEVKKLEIGNHPSPSQNKKRKFSPIVWDLDDREVRKTVKSRSVSEIPNLSPPPVIESHSQSHNFNPAPAANVQALHLNDIQVRISEASHSKIHLPHALPEFPAETSSLPPEDEPVVNNLGTDAINDDGDYEYVPNRRIISSRWANDTDSESPADEGEISDYEGTQKLKRSSSESVKARDTNSVSPELGEIRREGSENRGRTSGSEEIVRSSSRDSLHGNSDKNEYMEIDNYDGASASQSDSEDDLNSSRTPELSQPPKKSVNMLQGCRSVNEFERLNKIDEGTYGVVFRAKDKKTGEIVALKKVKMEKEREGFPLTSLREINILLSFDHPSIVNVNEVVVGSSLDSIFMVMEYMEHDLKALMETMKQPFSQSEVKCLMRQLLEGTKYLHDNWVLHRDLKTSNILLNNCGELKICDFGLARQYGSPLKPYTPLVVTLWYRAPEILLGAKQYSTAIDMWSLGCIMAELLSKEPLFNGKTELDQLDKIFRVIGTPNETIWPGCTNLPLYKVKFVKHKYNLLRKKFPATSFTGSPVLSDAGFDLMNKLLTYDPEKRITAEAALYHAWFREVPLPKSKEFMPTFPAQHAQDRRVRRIMKSPDPLEELRRKELQQGELGTSGLFGQ